MNGFNQQKLKLIMAERAFERDILESERSLGSAPEFDNERMPEAKVFNPWIVAIVVTMGTHGCSPATYSPRISVFLYIEFFVASGRSVVSLTNRILQRYLLVCTCSSTPSLWSVINLDKMNKLFTRSLFFPSWPPKFSPHSNSITMGPKAAIQVPS